MATIVRFALAPYYSPTNHVALSGRNNALFDRLVMTVFVNDLFELPFLQLYRTDAGRYAPLGSKRDGACPESSAGNN